MLVYFSWGKKALQLREVEADIFFKNSFPPSLLPSSFFEHKVTIHTVKCST